jgi:hypothetical protein
MKEPLNWDGVDITRKSVSVWKNMWNAWPHHQNLRETDVTRLPWMMLHHRIYDGFFEESKKQCWSNEKISARDQWNSNQWVREKMVSYPFIWSLNLSSFCNVPRFKPTVKRLWFKAKYISPFWQDQSEEIHVKVILYFKQLADIYTCIVLLGKGVTSLGDFERLPLVLRPKNWLAWDESSFVDPNFSS